jgi:hypothetical protein
MAVQVGEAELDLILKTEKAEAEADEMRKVLAEKIRAGTAEGVQKSEAEIKKLTDKVSKEMEKAAKAAEKLWSMEMIEQYAKGVKLIVGELDILNNAFGETINKAVEFGEVGGKIGGIWGAVIGAGIGAIEGHKDKIEAAQKEEIAAAQEVHDKTIATQLAVLSTLTKIYEARDKKTKELAKEHAKAEAEAAKKAQKAHEEAAKAAAKAWEDGWAQIREDAARGMQLAKTPAEIRAEYKAAQAEYDALLAKSREGGGRFKSLVAEDLGAAKTRLDDAKSAMDGLKTSTSGAASAMDALLKTSKAWEQQISSDALKMRDEIIQKGIDFRVDRETAAAETWFELERKRTEFLANEATQRREIEQRAIAEFNDLAAQYERMMQPIGQITGAVFDTLYQGIAQNNLALEDLGKAARGAVADVLRTLAKEWGAKAIASAAAGFSALALGPVGGVSAGQHFQAAALYAAAAGTAGASSLIAGAGTQAGGRSAGGGGAGGGSGGSSGGGSSPSLGRAANAGTQTQTPTIVNLTIQSLTPGDRRQWEEAGGAIAIALDTHKRRGGRLPS